MRNLITFATMFDMNSYTSPATNKTYTIKKVTSMRGHWDSKGNNVPQEHVEFKIYDGDKMVQFAFEESGIANAVKHYEFPGWDNIWTSRFD